MNKRGEPCGAPAVKGTGRCNAHREDVSLAERFGSVEQANAAGKLGGRPPLPRPTDIAKQLVEQNVAVTLAPHFRALGYEIEADEDGVRLVEAPTGGAKLYGTEQRTGVVVMSAHDDLGAQIAAAEKLLDRVYGRPKQSVEATGEVRGMVLHLDARDEQTRVRLHELLRSRPEIKEA